MTLSWSAVRPQSQLLDTAAKLGINIVTTYGSSETAGGCVYDGVALTGTEIRVDGGRIHLGGPTIAHGYRNAPGHEAFAEPGWFQTSDGGVVEAGVLTVTGRLDNIIGSGGLKLHPEVLETAMLKIAGVDQACVVGTRTRASAKPSLRPIPAGHPCRIFSNPSKRPTSPVAAAQRTQAPSGDARNRPWQSRPPGGVETLRGISQSHTWTRHRP